MHVASHHCIARHSVSYQMHLWLFYLVQNYELLLYNDIMVTILIKFQFSIFIRTMLQQFLHYDQPNFQCQLFSHKQNKELTILC